MSDSQLPRINEISFFPFENFELRVLFKCDLWIYAAATIYWNLSEFDNFHERKIKK